MRVLPRYELNTVITSDNDMAIASAPQPFTINEKLVAEVWKRQILNKPLHTVDGQRLEVVYAGRHCCDHGPDFRSAMIAFDGELRCGDIEIHVRDVDWLIHRHNLDPFYDGVILHVVMQQTRGFSPHKSNGEAIPVLCVEPYLATNLIALPSFLTTTPYVPFRCRGGKDPEEILALLDVAGQQRLRDKAALFEGNFTILEPEEALYRAIMIALGYTRNTEPFAQLAEIVPFSLLRSIALCEGPDRTLALQAFLLGKAALLASQLHIRSSVGCGTGDARLFKTVLEQKWLDLSMWDDGLRVDIPWRFGRVRPDNFPTVRLLGAGEMIASLVQGGLCETFVSLLRSGEPETACDALERVLMVKGFVGKARAAEIIINAILPFAVAYGQTKSDGELSRRAAAAFRSYRLSADNEITRYMATLICDMPRLPSLRTACRQQGLLHIYKTWCAHKRCADCRLAAV